MNTVTDLLERAVWRLVALYASCGAVERERVKSLLQQANSAVAAHERRLFLATVPPRPEKRA